jgi:predicted Kef-type K+ transport protein
MAPLGYDFLKFLAAFVLITPIFKRMNVSPVLGFLLAGVILRRTKYVSIPEVDRPTVLAEEKELLLGLMNEMALEFEHVHSCTTHMGTMQWPVVDLSEAQTLSNR